MADPTNFTWVLTLTLGLLRLWPVIQFYRNYFSSDDTVSVANPNAVTKNEHQEIESFLESFSDIKLEQVVEGEKKFFEVDDEETAELVVRKIYARNLSNYKIVLLLAKSQRKDRIAEYFLSSLLLELRANYHQSPSNLMEIIDVIKTKKSINEKLRNFAEDELVMICAEKFKLAILSNSFHDNSQGLALSNGLFQFDNNLYTETMHRVIDSVYSKISITRLIFDIVNNEEAHYSQIVNTLVYIYGKLKDNSDYDNPAIFLLAHCLRHFTKTKRFPTAGVADAVLVGQTINDFPLSLRNLFFAEKVLLENVEYTEHMMTADVRHQVLTSKSGRKLLFTPQSAIDLDEYSDREYLVNEFTFAAATTREFLHVLTTTSADDSEPLENLYLVRKSNEIDDRTVFLLELKNNSISIRNRATDTYVCAAMNLSDEGKRHVIATKNGHSGLSACQWRVEEG